MKPVAVLLTILLIASTPIFSYAQQSHNNEVRVGIDENHSWPLTMADVIRLALENNRDIEVERINAQQAGNDLLIARGSYDPTLSLGQFFTRQLSPVTSTLGGSTSGKLETKTLNSEFSLRGLVNTGLSYDVSATLTQVDTANLFATLNPQTNSSITFLLRQPLLRNRAIDEARRRIRIAQRRLDISDQQFRLRVIEIITQVQRAYWDLVFARRNVEIARQSVALAESQIERAQHMIDAGSQAPVDLVQIEAQRQRRQEDVLVALENITRAENALKMLMLAERTAPEWQYNIVPMDAPQVKILDIDLAASIQNALVNRPELTQFDLQQEITRDDISYFRNQTKPQLDLIVSYNFTGLAGTRVNRTNPLTASNRQFFTRLNEISQLLNLSPLPSPPTATVPDFLVGGLGQSFSNLFTNTFNSFRVGVQLQLPLRNLTARGQLARAELESRKATVQRQRMEGLIENEVRNALQSVRTSQERIQTAHAARVAAELQLESEQRRYEAGLSTNFLVLTRQQELSETRGRELRALTDYDKALVELQRATGTTLSLHNVEIHPPHP
ncbi:MAG: TolC family protein [Acidobacteriota bacterium]